VLISPRLICPLASSSSEHFLKLQPSQMTGR
jgi:hypothetical protein